MTPEQFVFWLSGFFSGINIYGSMGISKNEADRIEEALKKVKLLALTGVNFDPLEQPAD